VTPRQPAWANQEYGVNSRSAKAGEHEIRGRCGTLSQGGSLVHRVENRSLLQEPVTRPRIPSSRSQNCEGLVTTAYALRCRECGKTFEVQPRSYCDECFSPLEVAFDLEYARTRFTREKVSQGPANMWRYRALLPVGDDYVPRTPAGFTPLVEAPLLGGHIGANNLYIKNDAVCMPTLSFKDRVVAVALANAQAFGFDTVGCSSTGNLANAVAAHAARLGLKTFILVPADLEPAKILNTQVYGATLVRVDGNYDHVAELADCRALQLGLCEREPAAVLCRGLEDGGL